MRGGGRGKVGKCMKHKKKEAQNSTFHRSAPCLQRSLTDWRAMGEGLSLKVSRAFKKETWSVGIRAGIKPSLPFEKRRNFSINLRKRKVIKNKKAQNKLGWLETDGWKQRNHRTFTIRICFIAKIGPILGRQCHIKALSQPCWERMLRRMMKVKWVKN